MDMNAIITKVRSILGTLSIPFFLRVTSYSDADKNNNGGNQEFKVNLNRIVEAIIIAVIISLISKVIIVGELKTSIASIEQRVSRIERIVDAILLKSSELNKKR